MDTSKLDKNKLSPYALHLFWMHQKCDIQRRIEELKKEPEKNAVKIELLNIELDIAVKEEMNAVLDMNKEDKK
jgi:hypothetical protein